MRYGLDVIKRNGIEPKEIRLAGGGAKSNLWRQIVADIFDCEVVCLQQEEAGAVGAALQALWCTETNDGNPISIVEITDRFITLDERSRLQPQKVAVSTYNNVYKKYLACNDAMAPTFDA